MQQTGIFGDAESFFVIFIDEVRKPYQLRPLFVRQILQVTGGFFKFIFPALNLDQKTFEEVSQ